MKLENTSQYKAEFANDDLYNSYYINSVKTNVGWPNLEVSQLYDPVMTAMTTGA